MHASQAVLRPGISCPQVVILFWALAGDTDKMESSFFSVAGLMNWLFLLVVQVIVTVHAHACGIPACSLAALALRGAQDGAEG